MLRRDRAIVAAALAAITLLAWLYLLGPGAATDMAGGGAMMGMAGMGPEVRPWSTGDALLMLAMWAVMMIGMMTPSAAPMILLYARVGRQAAAGGRPFVPAGWFAGGYLLAWTAFAAAATVLQWLLEQAMLLTPMAGRAGPLLGGALLIVAGLYQWTPWKNACLSQCRSPFQFIQRHGGFRGDRAGALSLGLRHGAFCIGCCWGLMLLLFVGGVMNLLWVAGIAMLVLIEKVFAAGPLVSRAAGILLVASGIASIAHGA